MKKSLNKICSLLLGLVLLMNMAILTHAESRVVYDGDAQDFIITPGSQDAPTNLFPTFQDLMPGDSVSEKIIIVNRMKKKVRITVYLRALGADEESQAMLSQMNLTVKQGEETVLFEAPADSTAQLTDWVSLGTLHPTGQMELDVTLDIPVTLDNRFQDSTGSFTWEFKVVEIPYSTPPQTGDSTNVYLYIGVMVFSLAALVILVIIRGKENKK